MTCPNEHKHGATLTCYQYHRCRCAQCVSSKAASYRAYKAGTPWREPDPYAVDAAVAGDPVDYLTITQRAEAVKVLWSRRWSDGAIAERLGITARSVIRIRKCHGWPGWHMREMQKWNDAA